MAVSAKLRAAGLMVLFLFLAAAGATGSDTEPLGNDSLSGLSRIVTSIDTTETQNYVRIADRIYPALWEEDNNFNYTLNDLFQPNNYQLPTNKSDYALTPEYLGSALWTFAQDVRVEGDIAYVAFGPGLALFNISDPTNPQLLSKYYLQKGTGGLDYANGYLFMADRGRSDCALMKFDVTDPYNPQLFATLYEGFDAWNIEIEGNLGYLCAGDSGLQIFNAFYYNTMIPLGKYHMWDAMNASIRDDNAYVVDRNYRYMKILDVNYAQYPEYISTYSTEGFAAGIDEMNGYVYIAVTGSVTLPKNLSILNVNDVYNPELVSTYDDVGWGQPCDIKVNDNIAYLSLGDYSSLHILDISNPALPARLGSLNFVGDAWALDVKDEKAYVAGGWSGLWIGDVSNPSNPSVIGSYNGYPGDYDDVVGYCFDVDVQGNYAYVVVAGSGLSVVDISDPLSPITLGVDGFDFAMNVALQGDYAYIAQRSFGFRITDISNPSDPQIVSNHYTPGWTWDVAVKGDYIYAAADTSGLQICDISDPYNIARVGYYNDIYFGGHEAYSIDVAGDYAYLGDRTGLVIINITDPANPVPAGEKLYTSGMVREVKVRGDYAYLADAGCGMRVVDISDPAHPTSVGVFDELCDVPCDIALYGKYAYIANGTCIGCEVKIVDVSDPSNMTLAGVYETPGECVNGIATDGQNIYVADAYGFYILDAGIDYVCGDATNDGTVNLLDAVYMIDYLYKNGEPMAYSDAGDTDGSGAINLLDIAYLINYLYKSGPAPWC